MFSNQLSALPGVLEGIDATAGRLAKFLEFAQTYRDSDGRRFDERGVVSDQIYTLIEAIIYSQQAIETFKSLKFDKNKVVPSVYWNNCVKCLNDISSSSSTILSQSDGVAADSRALRSTTGSTLSTVDTSEVAFDFTPNVVALVKSCDVLFNSITFLYGASKAAVGAKTTKEAKIASDDAAAAAAALARASEAARQADGLLQSLTATLAAAESERAAFSSNAAALSSSLISANTEAQAALDSVRSNSSSVSDGASVASSRITEITSVKAQADSVAAELTAYISSLGKTKQSVDNIISKSEGVVKDFEGRREAVDKLIADAEAMLKGSTVAALAQAFDKERLELDRSMRWAFIQFCIGISLIIVASVFLAIYVLNIPLFINGINLAHPFSTDKQKGEIALGEVLSRAVLIIGPFWFTRFAAARYRSLFDLRQQYSHKYNMAFSVQGFKLQAPTFADWIAAWVFTMIAESPLKQSTGNTMDTPPPLSPKEIGEGIVKQAAKVFGVDLSKFALPGGEGGDK